MSSKKNGHVFYRDVFGGWRWEHTDADGLVRESNVSYDTREECVAAARSSGVNGVSSRSVRSETGDAFIGRAILCACPDASRQAFLHAALEPAQAVVVSRGDAALKAMNGAHFDAYVVDFWLPDWSGCSLAREIRKSDPNVPIVFLTRALSEDAKRRAFRAGADAFLTVPQDDAALRRRVLSLITACERAKLAAERAAKEALAQEVSSRLPAADEIKVLPPAAIVTTVERRARVRALNAFLTSGGTRADFERTWTGLFSQTSASIGLTSASIGLAAKS